MSGTQGGTGIRQASSFPERHVDGRIGGAGGFEDRDKGVGLLVMKLGRARRLRGIGKRGHVTHVTDIRRQIDDKSTTNATTTE